MTEEQRSNLDAEEPAVARRRRQVMERMRRVIDPDEMELLLESMETGAPETTGWLEHLVEAAVTLPLPEPPPELSIRLRTMFPAAATRPRHTAILTHDSRVERELVGVRSGRHDDEGWTLTFATDLGGLLIDIWPHGENHDIEAQLMSDSRGSPFELSLLGDTTRRATSDRLGRAALFDVPAGPFDVHLVRSDAEIFASIEIPEAW